jgi:hypothetical protein
MSAQFGPRKYQSAGQKIAETNNVSRTHVIQRDANAKICRTPENTHANQREIRGELWVVSQG